MGRRAVLGEELVPTSCSFHGFMAEAPIWGDRWFESGGAGARKQGRVFLLYIVGHWSRSSTGAQSVGPVSQLSRLTVALF